MMNRHPTSGNQLASYPVAPDEPHLAGHRDDRDLRCSRLRRWLVTQIASAGDLLFRADDDFAESAGWEVSATHGGLGRTYRDPRFDIAGRQQ
jgi:hypothetical protein